VLRRVAGGELAGRHVVLTDVGRSRYNLEAMLKTEGLTVVERRPGEQGGSVLMGRVDPAVRDTYLFMVTHGETTARDVKEHFALETTSAGTNRLTTLAKLGLARRVAERAVDGGGREYVYQAVW
jgi:hypothetical protein